MNERIGGHGDDGCTCAITACYLCPVHGASDPYPSSEEVDAAVIAQLRQRLAEASDRVKDLEHVMRQSSPGTRILELEARIVTLTLGLETEQALHEQTNADRLGALAQVATLTRKNETLRNAWQTSESDRQLAVERADALESRLALLSAGVQIVLKTFKKDEAQGYRSRDRQYAIEILERALTEPMS